MKNTWYYQTLGEEFGPTTIADLDAMLRSGSLSAEDPVRQEGTSETQPLGVVLQQETSAAASRVDHLAEPDVPQIDQFVFENNHDSSDLHIDDIVFERSEDSSDGDLPAIDEFVIERESEVEEPSGSNALPEEEKKFYLRSGATVIGPLAAMDLCRMADTGKVTAEDTIREEGEDQWRAASEVPEVMAAVLIDADAVTPSNGKSTAARNGQESGLKNSGKKRRRKKRKKKSPEAALDEFFEEVLGPDADQESSPQEPTPDRVADAPGIAAQSEPKVFPAPEPSMAVPPMPVQQSTGPTIQTPPFERAARFSQGPTAALADGIAAASLQATTASAKRKKSSALSRISVKQVGIVTCLAAVVAIGWFVLPMLSFGSSLPTQEEVAGELTRLSDQYESSVGSGPKWKEFGGEVRTVVGAFLNLYKESAGQRTPRDIELQEAATALVRLANTPVDKTDQHEVMLALIDRKLSGKTE